MICRANDYALIDIIPALDYLFKSNSDWHHTDRLEILVEPSYEIFNSYVMNLGYDLNQMASEYYAMINSRNNNNGKGS